MCFKPLLNCVLHHKPIVFTCFPKYVQTKFLSPFHHALVFGITSGIKIGMLPDAKFLSCIINFFFCNFDRWNLQIYVVFRTTANTRFKLQSCKHSESNSRYDEIQAATIKGNWGSRLTLTIPVQFPVTGRDGRTKLMRYCSSQNFWSS